MTGGFSTFTVVVAVEVLFDVSAERAIKVVEPFAANVVSHDTEYNVPIGVVTEPMSVEDETLSA
jgi:hypothetical protein